MKVAVFNDTGGSHFGCDTVMAVLRRSVAQRGGEIIHSQPFGRRWSGDSAAEAAMAAADLVIVNGEGSIHHSRHWARELASLAPHCARIGTPAYLVNATVEANDRGLMAELLAFRAIYVRDSASLAEIRAAGGAATVVGDLSLGSVFPSWSATTDKPVVVDTVVSRQRRLLARIAHRLGCDYVSMKYDRGGAAFERRRWLPGYSTARRQPLEGVRNADDFAAYLSRHSYLVTGRYHALCFAIGIGMPVSVMPSNTAKCEALLADVGLDPRRVFRGARPPAFMPYSDRERASIASFLDHTRAGQAAMFDAILGAVPAAEVEGPAIAPARG